MENFSELSGAIKECLGVIIKRIKELSLDEQIATINSIKKILHEVSPMKNEPVDCVVWIGSESLVANNYNPNSVANPEMLLLQESIMADGYTQPVVSTIGENYGEYEVVDGFHRTKIGKEVGVIKKRVYGRIPVTIIRPERTSREDRMASTIRHNRARGKHSIDLMAAIVLDLTKRCWSDEKIGKELGMDPDEVLRLKQINGLMELFKDKEFSEAWEPED